MPRPFFISTDCWKWKVFRGKRLTSPKMKSKMKSQIAGLIFVFLTATGFAANTNTVAVIPLPQKVEMRDGVFRLTADTAVYADSASRATAEFLAERLRPSTGSPLKISAKPSNDKAALDAIFLTTENA